jgi:hypothetical protein
LSETPQHVDWGIKQARHVILLPFLVLPGILRDEALLGFSALMALQIIGCHWPEFPLELLDGLHKQHCFGGFANILML